jgi:hypothetical protein
MRTKSISLTTLLTAGAAAVAIVAAPTAAAASTGAANPSPVQAACAVGPGTECVTPGNAQINDSPPGVSYDPYGDFGLALGGFGGGYNGGGFGGGHGGGGHR